MTIRKAQRFLQRDRSSRLSLTDILGRRPWIPPDASKSVHPARQGVECDADEVPNRRAPWEDTELNFIATSWF